LKSCDQIRFLANFISRERWLVRQYRRRLMLTVLAGLAEFERELIGAVTGNVATRRGARRSLWATA
jgi:hypothetical protein